MPHPLLAAADLLAVLQAPLTAFAAAPPAMPTPASDPAFGQVWARTDQLVRGHNVNRSWYWGDSPFARLAEPFGPPGTTHLVEYYDKSRMEIGNSAGDRNSPWCVTNGLLVKELISGQVATGPDTTESRAPSTQPVVGDATAQNPAPSYAALGNVASLAGPANRAPNRVGTFARATLDHQGRVGDSTRLGTLPGARLGTYVTQSGHNIPDIFWNYLQAQGPLLTGRTLSSGRLIDWVYAMGYPITEPYWVRARVGTSDRDVLVQAFERRILSYTPGNTAAWQVEMANAGRHYYDWRYGASAAGRLAPAAIATRIVSAAAHVDTGVVPTYVDGGAWQVADYAAGWLYGTSQPGQPGNSVFAGHNNYHGEVFRYLELLHVGDTFTIYTSDNVVHRYRVSETYKLPERFANRSQQIANAHYVDNTADERVTLITCWPYTTYTHRLIVIGKPVP